jgi:glycosyltransferase involved in cell wall biosynthesis
MRSIDNIVVINDFANALGGATVVALLAVKQYRRLGYPVTYISGAEPSAQLDELGVTQIALNSAPLLDLPARRAAMEGLHNRQAEQVIARWIRENDTGRTVYHLHNWSQILSPSIFRALRKVESRMVVTCHDFFNICPNGGFSHYRTSSPCHHRPLSAQCLTSQCDRRNAAQKYWRILRHMHLNSLARFGRSHSTFTFLHDRMRDKFVSSGFPANDLVSIPNPVEPWTTERIEAERNEGFLFVGRFGQDKGADLAIRAARAAGQKITLIGTGKLAPGTVMDGNVEVAGWKSRAEIAEIARHARALIAPSRVTEPFGLVILEAAMSGLPVIVASHAYLAPDVLASGFGDTFNIDRRDHLTQRIAAFATDDERVAMMSQAGFERAHLHCHTPESWISKFLEIFEMKLEKAACA